LNPVYMRINSRLETAAGLTGCYSCLGTYNGPMNKIAVNETIVAVATPAGRGGIGVVRISGPDAPDMALAILGHRPAPRQAEYLAFKDADGEVIDWGIALIFAAPHSFTGEHVLELQGHGGPVVMDRLVQRATALGARPARPGEFSEQAFLNDKMDLAQAEAIADLIDSASIEAARAAIRSLSGVFSEQVHALLQALTQLRMLIEAAIDFPEEQEDFLSDASVIQQHQDIINKFKEINDAAQQGCLLREGMNLVIAGLPNVGKSSLLNALAGQPRAIVTNVPGTTRDVLRQEIQIDGLPLHVIDTAGLRDTEDEVERLGVDRAWQEIGQADQLLLVIDDQHGLSDGDRQILGKIPHTLGVTLVYNKIDLSGRRPGKAEEQGLSVISLSAKQGDGVKLLRQHLKHSMGFHHVGEGQFMARRRHLQALARTERHLNASLEQLSGNRAGELAAEELRQAQLALAEITGEFSSDDLLGKIFSSFCIGK